ncbi:FkbM family methyltransferase [Sphingomonas sp.]|jgi:FkbM family methyltransferase|uniref:FkbM family methyltransferase n=1 Tax=Sphingomonas sp. TaxID=28214 RepID=UPI002E347284|nr:FkbM family methyltransferase [Sphingomonas sp.]HEX4695931.1 FkbM family methyltransferase [Sphingomonas sp.]
MADRPARGVKRRRLTFAQHRLRFIQRQINERPRLREWLMRLRWGGSDRDVVLFQRVFRINALRENGYFRASKLAAANSLLRDETLVLQRVSMLLGPGTTFVDVGANIGIFSSVIADAMRLFDNFRVVAFEASPDTFARLIVNAERFGFEAVNVALADRPGELDFISGAVSGVATARAHAGKAHIPSREFRVAARRLDSFGLTGRLVIKIDVEGMELAVLEGARALFGAGRIAAVYLDEFGDKPAVLDFLTGYGFDLIAPPRLTPYNGRSRSLFAVRRGDIPGTS